MKSSRHERGFSLLEVLVSFVILALTLGVLLGAYGTSVRNAAVAEQHLRAATVAESLLARMGRDTALNPGEASGEIGVYRWHWLILPYELPPLPPSAFSAGTQATRAELIRPEDSRTSEDIGRRLPKAFQIRLTLAWGGGPSARSVTMSTLRIATQNESENPL